MSEVEKAYALLDAQNALLDAFEAANPEVAVRLPWFEARQAWKAAGRPRPPWYEALYMGDVVRPIPRHESILDWPYPPKMRAHHRAQCRVNQLRYLARKAEKERLREEPFD